MAGADLLTNRATYGRRNAEKDFLALHHHAPDLNVASATRGLGLDVAVMRAAETPSRGARIVSW